MSQIESTRIQQFHSSLFSWWNENKREFPWRETHDPYHILVSEFMLQQTQANRVIKKYTEFITRYSDIDTLSKASNSAIIKSWQGLGYNRRALWLRDAAQYIVNLGYFPQDPTELEKIKGIGKYTSRSIPIFAFNADLATVDTNIRRILIHEKFADVDSTDRSLFEIAEQLLPKGNSRNYHNALMDYGATHLTSKVTGIKPRTTAESYKGSNRQIRGTILQIITNGPISLPELYLRLQELSTSKTRINTILNKMNRDGLLIVNNNEVFI
ncbi:MAG: Fe-S cluster assembly protein HesB [Candidatus Heimdallarchaeota archaeon]|nr:Fe-S cluster assembly protein HesB [Candidatus Heimdallarchaeota archaeon]